MWMKFFMQCARPVIKLRNILLEDVAATASLGVFKKHLDKYMNKNPLKIITFQ